MSIAIDLITLVVLTYIAWMIAKTKGHVAPQEADNTLQAPLQDSNTSSFASKTSQEFIESTPVLALSMSEKSESNSARIVIDEPISRVISDEATNRRSNYSIAQSGEIVIDSDGDLFGLLSKEEVDISDSGDGDLVLADDIELGGDLVLADDIERGGIELSLDSRLREEGFDVSLALTNGESGPRQTQEANLSES